MDARYQQLEQQCHMQQANLSYPYRLNIRSTFPSIHYTNHRAANDTI